MKTIILIAVLYVSWTLAEEPKINRIRLRKRHAIIKRDVSHLLGNQGKSQSQHHHHHQHNYDGMAIPTLDTNEQNENSQYQIGKYAGVPMMGWFDATSALGLPQSGKTNKYRQQAEQNVQTPQGLYLPAGATPPQGVHYLAPVSSAKYPNMYYQQQNNGKQAIYEGQEEITYQPYPQPTQPTHGGQASYLYPQPTHGNGQTTYLYPQPAQQINSQEKQIFTGYRNAQVKNLPAQQTEEEPIYNYKPIPHPGVDVPDRNYLPIPKPEGEVPPNYLPVPVENPEEQTPPPAQIPTDTPVIETPSKNYLPIGYLPPRSTESPAVETPSPNYLPVPTSGYLPPRSTEASAVETPSHHYVPVPTSVYLPARPTDTPVVETPTQNYIPVPIRGYLPPRPTDNTIVRPPSRNYLPAPATDYLPPSEFIKEQFKQPENYLQQQNYAKLENTQAQNNQDFNGQYVQTTNFKKNPWTPVTYDHQSLNSDTNSQQEIQWIQQNIPKNNYQLDTSSQHSHNIETLSDKLLTNQDQNRNAKYSNEQQIDSNSEQAKAHWSHSVQSRYRHKDHSRTSMNLQQIENQLQQQRIPVDKAFAINKNPTEQRYMRSNENQESAFNGYGYESGYQYPTPAVMLEESAKIIGQTSDKYTTQDQNQQLKQSEINVDGSEGKPEEIKFHEQTFTGIKHRNPVKLAENNEEVEVAQENQSEIEHLNEHEEIGTVEDGGEDEAVIGNPSTVLQPPKYTSGFEQSNKSGKQAAKSNKKFQYKKVATLKESNKQKVVEKVTEKGKLTTGEDILVKNKRPVQQINHNIPQGQYQKVVDGHFPSGNGQQTVSDLVISVSQKHHREIDQFQHASKSVPIQYSTSGNADASSQAKIQQRPVVYEESQPDVNAHQYQEINDGKEQYTQQQIRGALSKPQNQLKQQRKNKGNLVQPQINEGLQQDQGNRDVYRQNNIELNINGEEHGLKLDQVGDQHPQQEINDPNKFNQQAVEEDDETDSIEQEQFNKLQESFGGYNQRQQPEKFRVIEDYNNQRQVTGQTSKPTNGNVRLNKFEAPNKSEVNQYQTLDGYLNAQQIGQNQYRNEGSKSNLRNIGSNQNQYIEGSNSNSREVANKYRNEESKSNLRNIGSNQNQYIEGSKSESREIANKYRNEESKSNLRGAETQYRNIGSQSNLREVENQYRNEESKSDIREVENQYRKEEGKYNSKQVENQYRQQGSKTVEVNSKQVEPKSKLQRNQYQNGVTRVSPQQIVEITKNQQQLQNDFQPENYGIEFSYGSGNGTGNTKVWLDPTHGIPDESERDNEENADDDAEYYEVDANRAPSDDKNKSEDLIILVNTDVLRGVDRFRNRGRGGRRFRGRGGRGRGGGRTRDFYREEDAKNVEAKSNDDGKQKGKQSLAQESQVYSHPNHSASNGHSQTEPEPYYY